MHTQVESHGVDFEPMQQHVMNTRFFLFSFGSFQLCNFTERHVHFSTHAEAEVELLYSARFQEVAKVQEAEDQAGPSDTAGCSANAEDQDLAAACSLSFVGVGVPHD